MSHRYGQIYSLVEDAVVEVIDDAITGTREEPALIRMLGVDLDERQTHYRRLKHLLVAKVLESFMNTGVLQIERDPVQHATVKDPDLYGRLKDGFDEGRGDPMPGQKVGESATKPEVYEQLQLPGFEDDDDTVDADVVDD